MKKVLTGREVMWDFELAEKISNVTLKNHKPERKNIALTCDAPYEGEYSCYMSLVKDGDIYRMYYRGAGHDNGPEDVAGKTHGYICVAESRDGKSFDRTNEVFISPGIRNGHNWVYGDGYLARGLFETESDFPGEPNEMSFYAPFGERKKAVYYVRYTLRLDGFRSWSADNNGGCVLSRVIGVDANSLNINFSTSALGYLRIKICDENGDVGAVPEGWAVSGSASSATVSSDR